MKFLRFFYSGYPALVLFFLLPSLSQIGCGGGDDEVELEDGVDQLVCEDLHGGTVETDELLRDEFGIYSIDFESFPEERTTRFDYQQSSGGQGRVELSARTLGAQHGTAFDVQLSSDSGPDLMWSSRVGALRSIDGETPPIFMTNRIGTGEHYLEMQILTDINEPDLLAVSEDNPLLAVRSLSLVAGTGDQRIIQEVAVGGEVTMEEEAIEEWLLEHVDTDALGDERFGILMGILLDGNIHHHLSAALDACRSQSRAGTLFEKLVTVCEDFQSVADFGFGLVFSSLTKGLPTLASIAWDAINFGKQAGQREPLTMQEVGAVVGLVTIIVAGVVAGFAGALLAGVVVLAAGAILIAAAVIFSQFGCGNPLMMPLNRRSYPFRDTGEFVWYRHRARDSLHIQIRQVDNSHSRCADGRKISAVAVGSEGHRIGIYLDRESPLWIDGEPQEVSQYFWQVGDHTTVTRNAVELPRGESYIIERRDGERIRVDVFDRHLALEMEHLPRERVDEARGLVGNHEVDGEDGLILRDGRFLPEPIQRAEVYEQFGNSWRVGRHESLFDYGPGESFEKFAPTSFPFAPRSLDDLSEEQYEYGRRVCDQNVGISDPTMLRHCMMDVGCTGDSSYAIPYAKFDAPQHGLAIVDEQGVQISGPYRPDDRRGDSPGWTPAGPTQDIVQASCPSDIERGAESIGGTQIRTTDGLIYGFQSAGEFVLVESRADDGMMIQVRQEPLGGGRCPNARRNSAVAVQMGDYRLGFYVDGPGRLLLDGEATTALPGGFMDLGGGHTVLQTEDDKFLMEWPDRSWMHVTMGSNRIDIRFNAHYSRLGQLQGLFGQFNGYPGNDIAYRNGQVIEQWDHQLIHGDYADSWRISQSESLFNYDDGFGTADYTLPNMPASAMSLDDLPPGEEQIGRDACEAVGVTHHAIMRACILDVYCADDPGAAEAYRDSEEPNQPEWVELVPGSGDYCCHVDCVGGPDPECGFVCGTGQFEEPQEWCDGDCPISDDDCVDEDPDDVCTFGQVERAFPDAEISAYICASRCVQRHQWMCIDNDGCCPAGGHCTEVTDNDCDVQPHVGSGCTEDDHCATVGDDAPGSSSTYCITEEQNRVFGGFCALSCADDSECPDDTHCATDVLYRGQMHSSLFMSLAFNLCVPSCDSDADCPREGYGCYDANGDGRSECWHTGTGDGDFGDVCETSRDCGEIGDFAVCATENSYLTTTESREFTFCTQRCDLGGVQCPTGWECDATLSICVEPAKNEIGLSCAHHTDCESGVNNPHYRDRCFDGGDLHPVVMSGGYCTLPCSHDNHCPSGSYCADDPPLYDDSGRTVLTGGQGGYCVLQCEGDGDCPRTEYACFDANLDGADQCWHVGIGDRDYGESCQWASECGGVGEYAVCRTLFDDQGQDTGQGMCSRYCGNDDWCPSGWRCAQNQLGFEISCVPEVENEHIGSACTDESDCGEAPDEGFMSVVCLGEDGNYSYPGNYCSINFCDDDTCPAGSHCTPTNSLPDEVGMTIFGRYCVASCNSDADCGRSDYACYDATGDGNKECWFVGTGSGDWGDSCDGAGQCGTGDGAVCRNGMTAYGVCSRICSADEAGCPDGWGCYFNNICTLECEDDGDCPGPSGCIDGIIQYDDGSTGAGCM